MNFSVQEGCFSLYLFDCENSSLQFSRVVVFEKQSRFFLLKFIEALINVLMCFPKC